jgi:hypothetical protein
MSCQVQLVRVHLRVPEYGMTTQKVRVLVNSSSGGGTARVLAATKAQTAIQRSDQKAQQKDATGMQQEASKRRCMISAQILVATASICCGKSTAATVAQPQHEQ